MYRKFKADHIFNGYQFLQQHVLITDADGRIRELIKEEDAGEGIELLNGILCPGFINAHCHLELSHMKGIIPKHSGLVDFVLQVVTGRHFQEEEILAAVAKADDEMLRNGIVAVGDICNNTVTIPQKIKSSISYHNFIEASGFPPAVADQRFQRAVGFYNSYSEKFSANSIVPHAPYSVSPEMFALINEFPNNNLITIHSQEIAAENELFEQGTGDLLRMYEKMDIDISFFKPSGRSGLQTWLPHLTKAKTIILVHNVCTTIEDIEFSKLSAVNLPTGQAGNQLSTIFFCLCPNANLYISNTLPDVKMLTQQDCNIVLGTDSLASNDQLSILEEIKTLQANFPELSLDTMLQWATSNGSRALQIDSNFGSFETGKKPGVVLIEGIEGSKLTNNAMAKRIL